MSLIEREIQISWVIHAMKEIIGLENLRKYIIEKYYPDIKNKTFIKTFDSFQQYEIKPFNNKEKEIIEYCEKIIHLKNRVVFTATNIQDYSDVLISSNILFNVPGSGIAGLNTGSGVNAKQIYIINNILDLDPYFLNAGFQVFLSNQ